MPFVCLRPVSNLWIGTSPLLPFHHTLIRIKGVAKYLICGLNATKYRHNFFTTEIIRTCCNKEKKDGEDNKIVAT